jgi:hypothetical protein
MREFQLKSLEPDGAVIMLKFKALSDKVLPFSKGSFKKCLKEQRKDYDVQTDDDLVHTTKVTVLHKLKSVLTEFQNKQPSKQGPDMLR